jgi:hypothetical protein
MDDRSEAEVRTITRHTDEVNDKLVHSILGGMTRGNKACDALRREA